MDWMEIITNLGVSVGGLIACAWFINNNVTRDRNESLKREETLRGESLKREETLREESREREDRLIEANKELSVALTKVADTIETTNDLNRVLSENNKLFAEQLNDMNDGINKIINKLDSI